MVKNIASVLQAAQEHFEQEGKRSSGTVSGEWMQLLQAAYGSASLLVSAVKRCEQVDAFAEDVNTIGRVTAHFISFFSC